MLGLKRCSFQPVTIFWLFTLLTATISRIWVFTVVTRGPSYLPNVASFKKSLNSASSARETGRFRRTTQYAKRLAVRCFFSVVYVWPPIISIRSSVRSIFASGTLPCTCSMYQSLCEAFMCCCRLEVPPHTFIFALQRSPLRRSSLQCAHFWSPSFTSTNARHTKLVFLPSGSSCCFAACCCSSCCSSSSALPLFSSLAFSRCCCCLKLAASRSSLNLAMKVSAPAKFARGSHVFASSVYPFQWTSHSLARPPSAVFIFRSPTMSCTS
mmetsp:Transcript_13863/g.24788  ORF Transcript_13863/g.24788 Transcript_13863/m.24788 type:complete len:268 (-) Transcript_13863:1993-2796(-)